MNGEHGTIGVSRLEVGGPMAEAIVGLAGLALAIIGLANVFPWLLASIATIALGAAFVFESGAIGKRFSTLAREETAETTQTSAAWGGITAGFLAGCAGIALGILSILGIATMVLVPVAVIVYGVALLMDSGTRLNLIEMESEHAGLHGMPLKVAKEEASVFAGIQALMGLAAITLGILAIIKIVPLTLSLAALVAVGATVVIFSSPIGRIMSLR
ncbi:MAG: hypothetical protein M0Z81_03920 [Deltaproteobacteria bacterium]|jgi:hypothetical protein|nr:hypothetical protein [Deltaproteobacteria bacterium]